MNKTVLLLIMATLAASGCVSNSPQNEDSSLLGDNSVTTFTSGDENFTMTAEADNQSETYDLIVEQKSNITRNMMFSRYESVNITSGFMCKMLQQIAYNYSAMSNSGDSEGLSETDELSKGLDSGEDESEIPGWVFEDFTAEQVRYTLIDKSNSEVVASCAPTEDELNQDIRIEPDSENSRGIS